LYFKSQSLLIEISHSLVKYPEVDYKVGRVKKVEIYNIMTK